MKILYNARIYTLLRDRPLVSALAFEDGKIVAIGDQESILAQYGSFSSAQDLQGMTVWPGLTDAHLHLELYALGLQMVDCETETLAQCLQRIEEKARQTPPGRWIRGHGWNQNRWSQGFGTAADLDRVAADHPVYLTAKSLHAGWANSQALRLAGIQAATPDPPGGKIGRAVNGEPNGILLETAMQLIQDILPEPSVDEVAQAIDVAQETLWRLGITGVHDFDQQRCFSALQILAGQEKLRLRLVKSIPQENLSNAIALGLRTGFGNEFLRIGSVKLFADGALGPRTAAMLQPYEHGENETGMLFLDAKDVLEIGQQAVLGGLSLAVHAIGDRANREVLNAYQQLRQFEHDHRLPAFRHRIEHVQIIHPDDQPRLVGLNVIASMQPLHATSDMDMADQHWGKRSMNAYAFRSLLNLGTCLAFGSDAPVESPNPFWGLHAAVTRRRVDGRPGPLGWYGEQRLSLQEALQAYTTGPAYAAGLERQCGRLAPGFYADLTVMEQDPFEMPVEEIHSIQPKGTMIAGQWVWRIFD